MAIPVRRKDPNAVLDFGFDWSDWLASEETISTSSWTVPAGITKDSSTKTTTTAAIWLSGGTVGTTYRLINRIVTSDDRTDDRSLDIVVVER